jgi:hypothetical protein
MSFQNSGITPSGRVFYRGEAVLVEEISHLLCGRISEIGTGDGGEVIVFITVDQGVLNTMGGDKSKDVPATKYLGQGFHHQSTKQTRVGGAKPSLFCFANEEPTFAMAGAPDAEHAPVVEEVTQDVPVDTGNDPGKTAPLPEPPSPKNPEKQFDPADADHSGTVSRKEQKEFNRTHPHEAPGKK